MQPPGGWAVCTICMGWPITLAQPIQDITQHIASTLTQANGMNIMTQGESCVVTKCCYFLFVLNYVQYCKLKECHSRCVYQNYNRLIINNDSQVTQLYL